jgi:hypothetical protein
MGISSRAQQLQPLRRVYLIWHCGLRAHGRVQYIVRAGTVFLALPVLVYHVYMCLSMWESFDSFYPLASAPCQRSWMVCPRGRESSGIVARGASNDSWFLLLSMVLFHQESACIRNGVLLAYKIMFAHKVLKNKKFFLSCIEVTIFYATTGTIH